MFDPTKTPLTLPEIAHRSFVNFSARPYLGDKNGSDYEFQTYAEVAQKVKNLAGAFLDLRLERGARLAILGENAPEWAICDLACQMCGLISVPLFSTLPANQIQTILLDCEPVAIVVSDDKQAAKIEEIRAQLPFTQHLWAYKDFSALCTKGANFLEKNSALYEQTWPAAYTNDIATLIYTSGTTGVPKGVMLTHKNIISNLEGIQKVGPHLGEHDVFLSFLPLAHVYERTAGHFLPLRLGASIAYCESLFTVDKNLLQVRPTVMTCVPRFSESLREKLIVAASAMPEKRRVLYLTALDLAKKFGLHQGGVAGAPALTLVEKFKFQLFNKLVYGKIREKFGGRIRHFISGGAPISPDLGALFLGLGLETLEGYGLTETSPVIAVNHPGKPKLGTVGPPLFNVEVKIAPDGEILARGPSIMKGYWQKPEETAAVLDAEGWLHTGDIGVFEGETLKITDRKKDLLVLANGKNVAPQPIELRLQESRFIAQAVLLGDKLKSVSALLVPNFPALREWAAKENLNLTRDEELVRSDAVNTLFKREIERQTSDLADFERVRKFVILQEPLSAQKGELTPTLKVKRNVVAEKYSGLLG